MPLEIVQRADGTLGTKLPDSMLGAFGEEMCIRDSGWGLLRDVRLKNARLRPLRLKREHRAESSRAAVARNDAADLSPEMCIRERYSGVFSNR